MKLNFKVTTVTHSDDMFAGTVAEFTNESTSPTRDGQLHSFTLTWTRGDYPIELGSRYTLTLEPGASDESEVKGLGDE